MRKNLFKFLNFLIKFKASSNEKLLFSEILTEKSNSENPLPQNLFLELTLKSENELISMLNSLPETLKTLAFSEKMLLFVKISNRRKKDSQIQYSLELIESLMEDLLIESPYFSDRNEDFLEKTRFLEITDFFPEEFMKKLIKELNFFIISQPSKKWSLLEKISLQKSLIYAKNLINEEFIENLKIEFANLTKTQFLVLIKLLSKTNQFQDNKSFLSEFLHSNHFLKKLEKVLFKEWDAYTDIVKIMNNYEEIDFSSDFLLSVIEFLFIELEGNPQNPLFLIRHLNYILYKYNRRLNDFPHSDSRKDILFRILINNKNLLIYELVFLIFLKAFRKDVARIQHLLTLVSSLDFDQEPLNQRISMLNLVIKVTLEEEFKRNPYFKKKSSLIIDKILLSLTNAKIDDINNLESKDLANFFNSVHRIKLSQGEIIDILEKFLEKTVFLIKKENFKFPTLLNILKVFSENDIKEKFFYVTLEEKMMIAIEENLISIQNSDLLLMKKGFKSQGFGSRKLHIFLEDALLDKSPEYLLESWRNYKKREAKYMDKKEKVRKSYKYANKRKENIEEFSKN